MSEHRELAKLSDFDVCLDGRTFENITLSGTFNLEGSSSIGLGYLVDADFIKCVLKAVGVTEVKKLNGKSCWVTLRTFNGPVIKIEPLHKSDGEAFDITEWSERKKLTYTRR